MKPPHFTHFHLYTKDINKGHHPMIKQLPNGNLLYLQGHLTPYQAKKRMEEDAKRSTVEDGRNLFTEMFGDDQ